MIGLVVVGHSVELADAAVAFATRAIDGPLPQVVVAAGRDDGFLGTDAAAISRAITAADSGDGVLVLLDIGSALISAELGVEFLPDDLADRVVITPAPLVEGLVAAVAAAASGAGPEEADERARRAYAVKIEHVDDAVPAPPLSSSRPAAQRKPAASGAQSVVWRATIRNPHGLHIRPAAAVVTALMGLDADVALSNATTGAGPATGVSLSRVAALQVMRGQVLQARINGPDAERARGVLADLASRDFGEDTGSQGPRRIGPVTQRPAPPPAVGASDTLPVVGTVALRASGPSTQGYVPGAPKDELSRFTEAVGVVASFLDSVASHGDPTGLIGAQRALLADRELNHDIVSRITEGFSAVDAVSSQLARAARTFDALTDPYLRERGQDLRGLRRLLLLGLMERPLVDEGPDEPHVWVVGELDAPTALRLDPRVCLGVITTTGGATGHGVLTARSRGIPVLAGRRDATKLVQGEPVAFDPVTGKFWRRPGIRVRNRLAELRVERRLAAQRALSRAAEPAVTPDGTTVPVLANVSTLLDAREAQRLGADGAGLVRTEILFAAHPEAPTVDQQAEAYRSLGTALGRREITIRTWDAGADKPVAFLPEGTGMNPALGLRGIRTMAQARDAFVDQLRAILIAGRDTPVRVLLPMVSGPDEVRWARSLLEDVRAEMGAPRVPLGIMVEVPAAAIRARDFAGLVDFVSIGTNDLAQYVLAADRTDPDVGELASQEDPAVLDLVAWVCQELPTVPVGVCGDLAEQPGYAARLIELGVSSLSVPPLHIPEVKQAVRAG